MRTWDKVALVLSVWTTTTGAQQKQQPAGKSKTPRYVVTDLAAFGGGFSNSFGLNESDHVGAGSTRPDGTMRPFSGLHGQVCSRSVLFMAVQTAPPPDQMRMIWLRLSPTRMSITGWAFTPQGEVRAFLATPCQGAEQSQRDCR